MTGHGTLGGADHATYQMRNHCSNPGGILLYTSTYNNLGCPFGLMEFIETVPLYEIWLDKYLQKL